MGNKKRKAPSKGKTTNRNRKEPSYWIIVAVIGIAFIIGFGIKIAFFPDQSPSSTAGIQETSARADEDLKGRILLVASEFRCACDGCGELPLIECECDMPRGALEEKRFIRKKLEKGLSVEQVIQLVEKKYAHKII